MGWLKENAELLISIATLERTIVFQHLVHLVV